jgi:transcriptional/translational regulatory protein YebC/TACO1
LEAVRAALLSRGWEISLSELGYQAKTPVSLEGDAKKEVIEFMQELNGHDDVRRVHGTLK